MKKTILILFLVGIINNVLLINNVLAQAGVSIVTDVTNLPHNIASGINTGKSLANDIKRYNLALKEFEILVRNSAAPYFFVYDEVKNFDENMNNLKDKFNKFSDKKEIDKYFKKYIDPKFYANSPCYKYGGCTAEELKRLDEQREERINSIMDISKKMSYSIDEFKKDQLARYARLKKLNNASRNAKGHLEAQSYQNQYLSEMTGELMNLNKNMNKFNEMMQENANTNFHSAAEANAIIKSNQSWKGPEVKKFTLKNIGEK